MECLVDSSIFVVESSRKFVAKYLISLYNLNTDSSSHQVDLNNLQDSTKHDCLEAKTTAFSGDFNMCYKCIICHLKYVIEQLPSGLERTMSRQVSVTQLLLALVEEDALAAQEILRSSAIMLSCFKMLSKVNRDQCGKVIDVIFTLLKGTRYCNIYLMIYLLRWLNRKNVS